jgi:hypothetical protein
MPREIPPWSRQQVLFMCTKYFQHFLFCTVGFFLQRIWGNEVFKVCSLIINLRNVKKEICMAFTRQRIQKEEETAGRIMKIRNALWMIPRAIHCRALPILNPLTYKFDAVRMRGSTTCRGRLFTFPVPCTKGLGSYLVLRAVIPTEVRLYFSSVHPVKNLHNTLNRPHKAPHHFQFVTH